MIYIGITGQLLSGKSTASKFLEENFNAELFHFSRFLGSLLELLDLERSRKNLQDLGLFIKETYGQNILVKTALEYSKDSKADIYLMDGLRNKDDILALKEMPNSKIIYIKAKPEVRYTRMLERGEKAGEKQLSFEEFLESEKHDVDVQLLELEKYADVVVDNNGTREELEKELRKALL